MDIRLLLKAFGFILIIVLGIPGNVFILLKFTCIKIVEKKLLPANTIMIALMLSNIAVISFRVLPQALDVFGLQHLLDDIQCKLVITSYRISRAMAICCTCFLSIYQCALIAPVNKFWTFLKVIITQNVLVIFMFLLGVNLSIYCPTIYFTNAQTNATTSLYALRLVYCTTDFATYKYFIINGVVITIRDIICLMMMTLSSSYLVYVLLQHAKSIRGKRSSDRGQKKTIEYKASQSVILLVLMYVTLYGMDNFIWMYSMTLTKMDAGINDIRVILSTSYSALSPLLLIASNPKLQQNITRICKKKIGEIEETKSENIVSVNSFT